MEDINVIRAVSIFIGMFLYCYFALQFLLLFILAPLVCWKSKEVSTAYKNSFNKIINTISVYLLMIPITACALVNPDEFFRSWELVFTLMGEISINLFNIVYNPRVYIMWSALLMLILFSKKLKINKIHK